MLELFRELHRLQEAWRVFEPRPGVLREAEAKYRQAIEDPAMLHLVAEHEHEPDRLVGMGWVEVLVPSSMSNEVAAEVGNVYVRPEARGHGLGRALVAGLAGWASRQGAARLVIKTFVQNEEALRFWESLGFLPRYVQMTAMAADLAVSEPA